MRITESIIKRFDSASYPGACLRFDSELTSTLREACKRLSKRVRARPVPPETLCPFMEMYWAKKVASIETTLQQPAYLIGLALTNRDIKVNEAVMVDYGAGTGVFCLLAKELGFKTVAYNDIDDTITKDARAIAATLGLEADAYFVGGIEQLVSSLRADSIQPNLIVSYDCLEHIYDIDGFLRHVSDCSPANMAVVLASGANPLNPRVRRQLMEIQRVMEHEGRTPEPWEWHKDSYRACKDIRRDILCEAKPHINPTSLEEIVTRTRGMRTEDILKAANEYERAGELPPIPSHPTNTCEPLTGNFCERLMDPFELAAKLTALGVATRVFPGYRAVNYKPGPKDIVRLGLNVLTTALPTRTALTLSPYYVLVGTTDLSSV